MEHPLRSKPRPWVMGILNITPDSFSDGGRFFEPEDAVRHAEQLVADGADVLDVGGESSRPGAQAVAEAEERRRIVPVIRAIRARLDVPISVDTVKASVAAEALSAGASWINDISALRDDARMAHVAASSGAPLVLMHRAGTAHKQYLDFSYADVVEDVKAFFAERIEFACSAGIARQNLILDPGIGFGKKAGENCRLIEELEAFKGFGLPLLVGTSRKSFIGKLTGVPVERRLPATIASSLIAALRGADIVRVHDVAEVKQALLMARHILGGQPPPR